MLLIQAVVRYGVAASRHALWRIVTPRARIGKTSSVLTSRRRCVAARCPHWVLCAADAEPFRLEDWLSEIGVTPSKVAVTAKQLRDNDLDDRALLLKITADELKECGVASVGIRKCIIEAVRVPAADESLLAGFKCTWQWRAYGGPSWSVPALSSHRWLSTCVGMGVGGDDPPRRRM